MKDIKILEFFEVLDNQDSNAILIKKRIHLKIVVQYWDKSMLREQLAFFGQSMFLTKD